MTPLPWTVCSRKCECMFIVCFLDCHQFGSHTLKIGTDSFVFTESHIRTLWQQKLVFVRRRRRRRRKNESDKNGYLLHCLHSTAHTIWIDWSGKNGCHFHSYRLSFALIRSMKIDFCSWFWAQLHTCERSDSYNFEIKFRNAMIPIQNVENWNESIWIEKNEAAAASMTTTKAVIQIKWYKNLSPSATAVAMSLLSSSSSFTISAVKPHIDLVCVRAGVCVFMHTCVYIDWPFICMPINCRYYILSTATNDYRAFEHSKRMKWFVQNCNHEYRKEMINFINEMKVIWRNAKTGSRKGRQT